MCRATAPGFGRSLELYAALLPTSVVLGLLAMPLTIYLCAQWAAIELSATRTLAVMTLIDLGLTVLALLALQRLFRISSCADAASRRV